jgi:uncharacterized protein (TIGR02246 family)
MIRNFIVASRSFDFDRIELSPGCRNRAAGFDISVQALTGAPRRTETPMTDEAAIRTLVEARTTAMRNGDAATICESYATGAVNYTLAPPLRQPAGEEHDVAALQAWFAEKGGGVWEEVRDLEVTVDGDLALATSLQSMGAPPDAPQPFELWYRSTLGLRRIDGRWLIVHEHTSVPFHMDGSFAAATDLAP